MLLEFKSHSDSRQKAKNLDSTNLPSSESPLLARSANQAMCCSAADRHWHQAIAPSDQLRGKRRAKVAITRRRDIRAVEERSHCEHSSLRAFQLELAALGVGRYMLSCKSCIAAKRRSYEPCTGNLSYRYISGSTHAASDAQGYQLAPHLLQTKAGLSAEKV